MHISNLQCILKMDNMPENKNKKQTWIIFCAFECFHTWYVYMHCSLQDTFRDFLRLPLWCFLSVKLKPTICECPIVNRCLIASAKHNYSLKV